MTFRHAMCYVFYVEIVPRRFHAGNIHSQGSSLVCLKDTPFKGNSRSTSGGEKDTLTEVGALVFH